MEEEAVSVARIPATLFEGVVTTNKPPKPPSGLEKNKEPKTFRKKLTKRIVGDRAVRAVKLLSHTVQAVTLHQEKNS